MSNSLRSLTKKTTRYYLPCLAALLGAGSLILALCQVSSADTTLPETTAAVVAPLAAALPAPSPAPEPAAPVEEYLIPLPVQPPADRVEGHALESLIAQIRTGKVEEKRGWVLPMLVKALNRALWQAKVTCYSYNDSDGGGPYTRWGTSVRWGICAADPRYWGPGSIIWMGEPINRVLIVEDTGGAIKGEHRFDVAVGGDSGYSYQFGCQRLNYVVLNRVEPRRSWGHKPKGWEPPTFRDPAPPIEVALPAAPSPEQTAQATPAPAPPNG